MIEEDGALIIKGSDLVTDAEFSVNDITVDPAQGVIFNNGNDIWTFVPNANYHGQADLSVYLSDGSTEILQEYTVEVTPVNDTPIVGAPESASINENTSLLITSEQLLANSYDADNDSLVVTNISSNQGTLINNNDGTWTLTPDHGFDGLINLDFTVSDGMTAVDQSLTVTVDNTEIENLSFIINNQNTATPDYNAPGVNYSIADPGVYPTAYTLLGRNIDADGFSINLRINTTFSEENSASLDLSRGVIKNVAAYSDTNATVSLENFFQADVAFGDGGASYVTLDNVARGNIATGEGHDVIEIDARTTLDSLGSEFNINTFGGDDNITLTGGSQAVFNIDAGDGSDHITLMGNHQEAHVKGGMGNDTIIGSVSGIETIIYSGNLNEYKITYSAADDKFIVTDLIGGRDGVDTLFNIDYFKFAETTYSKANIIDIIDNIADPFNHIPIVPVIEFFIDEDTNLIFDQSQLLSQASDIDSDEIFITDVSNPSGIGELTVIGEGMWKYEPPADFFGMPILSFTISDGENYFTQDILVNVAPIEDAPEVVALPYFQVLEDSGLLISEAVLLAGMTDADGDTLSIVGLSVPEEIGTISNNGNGTWTFAPVLNFNGDVELSLTVTDGKLATVATTTIEVIPVNDAPVGEDKFFTMLEDGTLVISASDLLAGSYDVDGDALSISAVSYNGQDGTLVDNGDDTWTFTPDENFNGDVELSYTVSDGELTSTKQIELNIIAVNDAPIAGSVALDGIEDTPLIITEEQLLANSTDVDGDVLSVQNLSSENGTIINNGDGTWLFIPALNFNGAAQLHYEVSDGLLATPTNATIDIEPVNDAPDAEAVLLDALEDTPIIFSVQDLIGNSTDVDGDALTVLNVTATNGTLTDNNDGTWTYSPDANFNGEAYLGYELSDGYISVPSSAAINVAAVNDAPEVDEASFEMSKKDILIITEEELLAGASDVDGDMLSITNVTAAVGDIYDNGDGTWSYELPHKYNEKHSDGIELEFTVSDGQTEVIQTADIDVIKKSHGDQDHGGHGYGHSNHGKGHDIGHGKGHDKDPEHDSDQLVSDADPILQMQEDGTYVIDPEQLLDDMYDVQASKMHILKLNVDEDQGHLSKDKDGNWKFEPTENFNGNVGIGIVLTDGHSTIHKSLQIDVLPVNDAPTVDAINLTMSENGAMIISAAQLLESAHDVDGDTHFITNLDANNGSLTDNGNDTWTFKPDTNFHGEIDLAFTVSDGQAEVVQHANIDVEPMIGDLNFVVNDNLYISEPDHLDKSYKYKDAEGDQVQVKYHDENSADIQLHKGDDDDSRIEASSDTAADVSIKGFGSANINLGDSGDSDVLIDNVQKSHISTGDGDDTIVLKGYYDESNIRAGAGDNTVVGGAGDDTFHLMLAEGHNNFSGGKGWSDSIMLNSHDGSVSITQTSSSSWAIELDGVSGELITNHVGTIKDNHILFAESANGTITMNDGTSLDFSDIENIGW